MDLSPGDIEELRQIHKKLTSELLTDKEAEEMVANLFNLFLTIYHPIPKDLVEKEKEKFPEWALANYVRTNVQIGKFQIRQLK